MAIWHIVKLQLLPTIASMHPNGPIELTLSRVLCALYPSKRRYYFTTDAVIIFITLCSDEKSQCHR